MSNKLHELGFHGSKADTSLFFFKQGDVIIDFLIYVDDIIVVSSSAVAIDQLLLNLRDDFALNDIGTLHYFLGIEVSECSGELLLTQTKYAKDLIHKAGMKDYKSMHTPMALSEKLAVHLGDPLDSETATRYKKYCGRLTILNSNSAGYSFCCQQSLSIFTLSNISSLYCSEADSSVY